MISMKRGGRALLFVVATQKSVEKALYKMSYKLRNKR
jgi:hypothetical protein